MVGIPRVSRPDNPCPVCNSIRVRSDGKCWWCVDCDKRWLKESKKKNPDWRQWNKDLDLTDQRVRDGSVKSTITRNKLIKEGKINPTANLPPAKIHITKEQLEEFHSKMDQADMAKTLGISQGRVCQLLQKYDIETRSHAALVHWIPTPEFRKELSDRMMGNTNWVLSHEFPNKEEQKLIQFFEKRSLPFRYVGDGSFLIGGKSPDFINEERKLVIEFYGNLWHRETDEPERIKFFEEKGWKCLVVWGSEIIGKVRKDGTWRWEKRIYDKILRWMSGSN